MVSNQSNKVWSAFSNYAKTGNKSLLASFSRDQIDLAIAQFTNSVDRNNPAYKAMEMRVAELRAQEEQKRTKSEVWKDRCIGFFFAIAAGLVVAILVCLLRLNK